MEASTQLLNTIGSLNTFLNGIGFDIPCDGNRSDMAQTIRSKMSDEQLMQIDHALSEYLDIVSMDIVPEVDHGYDDLLSKKHLGRFLAKHSLRVSKKLTDNIGPDDIVEVYSQTHQQLFRSVNFFGLSSYSLEELTFIPWDQLFSRREEDFKKLLGYAGTIMESNLDMMHPAASRHILTEIDSGKKFSYELESAGAVYDCSSNQNMGYITVIKVKELMGTMRVLQ
jgi:hypothetical protein